VRVLALALIRTLALARVLALALIRTLALARWRYRWCLSCRPAVHTLVGSAHVGG
jgi:hypothetical protein